MVKIPYGSFQRSVSWELELLEPDAPLEIIGMVSELDATQSVD